MPVRSELPLVVICFSWLKSDCQLSTATFQYLFGGGVLLAAGLMATAVYGWLCRQRSSRAHTPGSMISEVAPRSFAFSVAGMQRPGEHA